MAKSEKSGGVAKKKVAVAARADDAGSARPAAPRKPKANSTSARRTGQADSVSTPAASSSATADLTPAVSTASADESQGCMSQSRFVTVLPAIPEEDLGLLPSMYDVDRLYAVPRDPERVFATWEISNATRRRLGSSELSIRFTFSNGCESRVITDSVVPGMSQYYCAVPSGMLTVCAALCIGAGQSTRTIVTTGPVGLAIAFVRAGTPVFARVDQSVAFVGEAGGLHEAQAPAQLPATSSSVQSAENDVRRSQIGYMPVSGRK